MLTGVPSQFIVCTADAQCTTAGGTTCDVARGFCNVGGSIDGLHRHPGLLARRTYTFDSGNGAGGDDWKDVLAQIYGGQNHTSAAALIADATEANADGTLVCTAAATCKRNPARIDCANPVRGVLLASYSSIIRTPTCVLPSPAISCTSTANCPLGQTCNTTTGLCQPQDCVKVKHAFRRDDLSGTTDAFQALVGLNALPPFTTLRGAGPNQPEVADTASTMIPFCNAGTAAMNKGFSDGLDLDPYRRACAVGPAPDRFGMESVCQPFAGANNSDATCYVAQEPRPSPARRTTRSASARRRRAAAPWAAGPSTPSRRCRRTT